MDIVLRPLRPDDIKQIVEIEREAFAPVGIGTPFKREVDNRYAKYLVAYDRDLPGGPDSGDDVGDNPEDHPGPMDKPPDISLWGRMVRRVHQVVKQDRSSPAPLEIAGYVGVWFQGNEAHITEIAVRADLRGQGFGELLLIGSVRAAVEYGSAVVTLEVRASNFIAQRLYEKYEFKTSGTRKGYYADNRADAVIMTTGPIHSEAYRGLFQHLQELYLARWGDITIED